MLPAAGAIFATRQNTAGAQTPDFPVTRLVTPGGVEFGLWGDLETKPAPILFVLAGTIDGTLGSAYFRQCGNELAEHGFISVSIDLPCHGTQSRDAEPAGLSGWCHRTANDVDFVAECNARISEVLEHLLEMEVADPDRIAACGTSRGGFAALQFAAHDGRVKCVAGFAPVTELAALSEFHAIAEHPFVAELSLSSRTADLAGRRVWIVIGDRDERVGTDHAISLARRLTAASLERELESRVNLHVIAEPRGHSTPRGSSRLAADWILRQLFTDVPAPVTSAESGGTSIAPSSRKSNSAYGCSKGSPRGC